MLQARIRVTLKTGILDPQGVTVAHAMDTLGFRHPETCRMGKYIELNYPDNADTEALEAELHKVCDRLLVNPNTESYSLVLVRLDGKGGEQVLTGARR